jgi:hypothetical protein
MTYGSKAVDSVALGLWAQPRPAAPGTGIHVCGADGRRRADHRDAGTIQAAVRLEERSGEGAAGGGVNGDSAPAQRN